LRKGPCDPVLAFVIPLLPYSSRVLRAKVICAANVYDLPQKGQQQDALFAGDKVELRGVEEVIRSFRALTLRAKVICAANV